MLLESQLVSYILNMYAVATQTSLRVQTCKPSALPFQSSFSVRLSKVAEQRK